MEIYILTAAVLFVFLILFFWKSGSGASTAVLKTENDALKINLAKAEERFDNLFKANQELKMALDTARAEHMLAMRTLESSKANLLAQEQRFSEQKAEIGQMKEQFNKDFELIATNILDDKARRFKEENRGHMDVILNPLKENIKAFEQKVELVYIREAGERNVLKGVISQLMEQNKAMSQETQNLTNALKGDNKKQGNWGEMILERVLERSGLVKDQEYRLQSGHTSSEGLRFQPDVVIDLPDNKHLVIDAKVSLIAYERLVNCDNEEEREVHIRQHVQSIRNHVTGLSSKNYSDLYKIQSPDFVMLFIPIESCFSIAVQKDAELFSYAWDKRVVIVSPSTLLATLRTIASIWKQERQNRNVMEIARLSGEMYDKFVGFIADMESLGKNLKQSQDNYDKAVNKLSTGRGNLSTTAEKIKKLGAKTSKQLEDKFLNEEDSD